VRVGEAKTCFGWYSGAGVRAENLVGVHVQCSAGPGGVDYDAFGTMLEVLAAVDVACFAIEPQVGR
jgi:hypothetical protein